MSCSPSSSVDATSEESLALACSRAEKELVASDPGDPELDQKETHALELIQSLWAKPPQMGDPLGQSSNSAVNYRTYEGSADAAVQVAVPSPQLLRAQVALLRTLLQRTVEALAGTRTTTSKLQAVSAVGRLSLPSVMPVWMCYKGLPGLKSSSPDVRLLAVQLLTASSGLEGPVSLPHLPRLIRTSAGALAHARRLSQQQGQGQLPGSFQAVAEALAGALSDCLRIQNSQPSSPAASTHAAPHGAPYTDLHMPQNGPASTPHSSPGSAPSDPNSWAGEWGEAQATQASSKARERWEQGGLAEGLGDPDARPEGVEEGEEGDDGGSGGSGGGQAGRQSRSEYGGGGGGGGEEPVLTSDEVLVLRRCADVQAALHGLCVSLSCDVSSSSSSANSRDRSSSSIPSGADGDPSSSSFAASSRDHSSSSIPSGADGDPSSSSSPAIDGGPSYFPIPSSAADPSSSPSHPVTDADPSSSSRPAGGCDPSTSSRPAGGGDPSSSSRPAGSGDPSSSSPSLQISFALDMLGALAGLLPNSALDWRPGTSPSSLEGTLALCSTVAEQWPGLHSSVAEQRPELHPIVAEQRPEPHPSVAEQRSELHPYVADLDWQFSQLDRTLSVMEKVVEAVGLPRPELFAAVGGVPSAPEKSRTGTAMAYIRAVAHGLGTLDLLLQKTRPAWRELLPICPAAFRGSAQQSGQGEGLGAEGGAYVPNQDDQVPRRNRGVEVDFGVGVGSAEGGGGRTPPGQGAVGRGLGRVVVEELPSKHIGSVGGGTTKAQAQAQLVVQRCMAAVDRLLVLLKQMLLLVAAFAPGGALPTPWAPATSPAALAAAHLLASLSQTLRQLGLTCKQQGARTGSKALLTWEVQAVQETLLFVGVPDMVVDLRRLLVAWGPVVPDDGTLRPKPPTHQPPQYTHLLLVPRGEVQQRGTFERAVCGRMLAWLVRSFCHPYIGDQVCG
eukprot:gene911-5230_t